MTTRTVINLIKAVSCGSAIACCLLSAPVVRAQDPGYPPPEFVATATPVYYEGHPAYFWNGRWFYRMDNGWGFYHEEPPTLRGWREAHPVPQRRFYEGRYEDRGYRRR